MKKRALLFAFALLFFAAAHLHVCCRVGVGGEWSDARYSLADARRGLLAAAAAAEEICPGAARLPPLEEALTLSLRLPEAGSRELSARILARTEGVSRLYAVRAEEQAFGTVEDEEALEERLRAALYSNMPRAASHARFAEAVEITPVYGRSGSAISPAELAALVSGVVPAVYTDREGNRVMG